MISVLKTKSADLPFLVECSCRNFENERWSKENFLGAVEKGSALFTARDFEKDKIIGFAVMDVVDNEGYIGLIAVDEQYRKLGVGRSLVWRLAQITPTVLLDVRASNQNAIAFYKALGFEIIATRQNAYRNPTEDMVTMRLISDKMTSACHCKKGE